MITHFLIKVMTYISIQGSKIGLNKIRFLRIVYSKLLRVLGSKSSIRCVSTKNGFDIYLNSHGLAVENEIINHGEWEPIIGNLMIQNLTIGSTFVDVGANIGYFSLMLSKHVGNTGKIFSFEPQKYNFELLCRSIKKNNFKNIIPYKLGLGSHQEQASISYVVNNPGRSSLIHDKDNEFYEKETIEVTTMDSLLLNEHIDLVKIDVEGYEYEVILGMKEIMKNQKPKIIMEFSPFIYKEVYGQDFSLMFLNHLYNSGYQINHIDEGDIVDHSQTTIVLPENFSTYLVDFPHQSNLLLVPRSLSSIE